MSPTYTTDIAGITSMGRPEPEGGQRRDLASLNWPTTAPDGAFASLNRHAKLHTLMPLWKEAAGARNQRRRRIARASRVLAVAGAFLLLSVQLTVAAHSHPRRLEERSDARGQLTVGTSLCPLCLVAFHLPVNPVSPTALVLPRVDAHAAPALPEPGFRSFLRASCPPRAPPRAA